jgi:hypothetical protein
MSLFFVFLILSLLYIGRFLRRWLREISLDEDQITAITLWGKTQKIQRSDISKFSVEAPFYIISGNETSIFHNTQAMPYHQNTVLLHLLIYWMPREALPQEAQTFLDWLEDDLVKEQAEFAQAQITVNNNPKKLLTVRVVTVFLTILCVFFIFREIKTGFIFPVILVLMLFFLAAHWRSSRAVNVTINDQGVHIKWPNKSQSMDWEQIDVVLLHWYQTQYFLVLWAGNKRHKFNLYWFDDVDIEHMVLVLRKQAVIRRIPFDRVLGGV